MKRTSIIFVVLLTLLGCADSNTRRSEGEKDSDLVAGPVGPSSGAAPITIMGTNLLNIDLAELPCEAQRLTSRLGLAFKCSLAQRIDGKLAFVTAVPDDVTVEYATPTLTGLGGDFKSLLSCRVADSKLYQACEFYADPDRVKFMASIKLSKPKPGKIRTISSEVPQMLRQWGGELMLASLSASYNIGVGESPGPHAYAIAADQTSGFIFTYSAVSPAQNEMTQEGGLKFYNPRTGEWSTPIVLDPRVRDSGGMIPYAKTVGLKSNEKGDAAAFYLKGVNARLQYRRFNTDTASWSAEMPVQCLSAAGSLDCNGSASYGVDRQLDVLDSVIDENGGIHLVVSNGESGFTYLENAKGTSNWMHNGKLGDDLTGTSGNIANVVRVSLAVNGRHRAIVAAYATNDNGGVSAKLRAYQWANGAFRDDGDLVQSATNLQWGNHSAAIDADGNVIVVWTANQGVPQIRKFLTAANQWSVNDPTCTPAPCPSVVLAANNSGQVAIVQRWWGAGELPKVARGTIAGPLGPFEVISAKEADYFDLGETALDKNNRLSLSMTRRYANNSRIPESRVLRSVAAGIWQETVIQSSPDFKFEPKFDKLTPINGGGVAIIGPLTSECGFRTSAGTPMRYCTKSGVDFMTLK